MILWGLEGCFNQYLPSPLLFFHLSIPCYPLPSFPSLLSKFLLFPPFLFFLLLLLSSFHLILFISVPSLPLLSAFVFSTPFFPPPLSSVLLMPLCPALPFSYSSVVLLQSLWCRSFLTPSTALSSWSRTCELTFMSLWRRTPGCRSALRSWKKNAISCAVSWTVLSSAWGLQRVREHVIFILVYLRYYGFWLTSEHQDEMQTEVQWTCSLVCSMQSKKICKIHFKC